MKRKLEMNRRDVLAALGASGAALGPGIQVPTAEARTVEAPPDLLVGEAEWRSLDSRRRADPDLNRFATLVLQGARQDLNQPPLERKLVGRRLLGVSREFIRRTLRWGFAWRMTGESVYLDRARREMLSVAGFADWNPSHFLDVAEMSTGMAIGYDWLFNGFSEDERRVIRAAIVAKGIGQARNGHKTFQWKNNWSQVCIGGMVLGALAVRAQEPDLARDLLAAARRDVFSGLGPYGPDGVYPEGPSYWNYGTTYSVLLVAALRRAGRGDWGVFQAPGFLRAAEFYSHAIGPSGKYFNFADGGDGQDLSSAIVHLAGEVNQPAFLTAKRAMIRKNQGWRERFAPLSLLWWPVFGDIKHLSPAFSGQGPQPVAIWRGAWENPNTLWFAIKGGGAAHNHGQMDAGSFVLDMDGLRWAKDLGLQDYNSLETRGIDLWNMRQDSGRWRVFRFGSDAHNTLTVGGRPHSATAMAKLRMVSASEALIDLASVLGVAGATRRVRFLGDTVELDDRIEGLAQREAIRWAMCTEAEIRIEGDTAILSQQGKTLLIHFQGRNVRISVREISAPVTEIDHPNPNTRQLVATAPIAADGSWSLSARFLRGAVTKKIE